PHFRGEGGLWTKFDPYKVAHIDTFRKDPSQYWSYSLNHRRPEAEPNPAHRALVELERLGHLPAVITQNTDGLHQRAGSKEVIELHGSSHSVVCLDCEARFPRDQVDRMNREHCQPRQSWRGPARDRRPDGARLGSLRDREGLAAGWANNHDLLLGRAEQLFAAGAGILARRTLFGQAIGGHRSRYLAQVDGRVAALGAAVERGVDHRVVQVASCAVDENGRVPELEPVGAAPVRAGEKHHATRRSFFRRSAARRRVSIFLGKEKRICRRPRSGSR